MTNLKRLTVFNGEDWVHKDFSIEGAGNLDKFVDCCREAIERLAEIEDILSNGTGYYNLDNLRWLVRADQSNRIIVLPCKRGDILNYFWKDEDGEIRLNSEKVVMIRTLFKEWFLETDGGLKIRASEWHTFAPIGEFPRVRAEFYIGYCKNPDEFLEKARKEFGKREGNGE